MATQKQINPRLEELRLQQQQVLQRFNSRIQELKDQFFFGIRFQSDEDVKRATSIFSYTFIALQCLSSAGCIYSIYRKRFIPAVALAALTEGLRYPVKYRLEKNEFIARELDALESSTTQAIKKISQQMNSIIQQQNNKGFFARLFGK